ncbi:MAG: hypothetical protein GX590_01105 [Lentisphaerae bacterium]|nr:hypothetical protein [Lentisphaerota bacterium]
MKRPVAHGVSRFLAAALTALPPLAAVLPLAAQQAARPPADWLAPRATLRVEAAVHERPADDELGIYLAIPDGGLLPRNPAVDVRDAHGKVLPHQILWHTPADALGVVFQPPAANEPRVFVYLSGSAGAMPRPAASPLKPSLFVFTRPGNPSLDHARRMASEWPPAQGAYGGPTDRIGVRWNPFGHDDHFSSWFTGWFKLDTRESLYLATISDEGSEVHLDGSLLVAWPGRHTRRDGARGQYGKQVTLEAGWHRIDYFHFEVDGDQEMCLVWRRGRDGKDALPVFMEGSAWGRTGRASVQRIDAADGRTVGWVEGNLQADGYLWTGNQPVHLHRLVCRGVAPAAGVAAAWDFGNGCVVPGAAACTWLVSGAPTARQTGQLVVTSPAGVSRQTFRFTSFTTPRPHALGSPADRLLYRQAFLDRLRAVPAGQDPCAAWNGDLWSTLVEILEPYKGGPILGELFERGWRTLQTLPAEQRHALEDRWAETLRLLGDTARQLAWIERLEKETRERARQSRWREERVACHLYDTGDLAAARRSAVRLRELAGSPDEIQRAILRLGDVELFSGNRDLAARHYADAQMRYRGRGRLGGAEGLSRFEPSRAIRASEAPGRAALRSLRSTTGDLKPSDAWKLYAVNDAAQSATIRTYLDQGALAEAQTALTQWENDTPMSKLSGDLLLTEARLYIQAGDFRRAAALLAVCLGNDVMTSQLPDIMHLQLDTLMRLKRAPEARALAEEAVKRFPGLPVAGRAEAILRDTGR